MKRKVLISGASIAGPTLGYWLNKYGFDVTIVERSPSIRLGGQNIDVNDAAVDIVKKMGIADQILNANTGEIGLQFIDKNNEVKAEFPKGKANSFTSDMEILRGDLVQILYELTKNDVAYHFGKYITALVQDDKGVAVTYSDGQTENYDIVIAADGIRSKTRDLVFGDEVKIKYVGIYNAYLTIPKNDTDTNWARWYNAPGSRVIMLRPDGHGTTRASFSFLMPDKGYQKLPSAEQKAFMKEKLEGAGWEADRIIKEIDVNNDVYFDAVSQVHAPRWSQGRFAMVGDAAYCPTPLTGMGTSLAIIGAYMLAGEMAQTEDIKKAFAAYDERLRPYVKSIQDLPPGVPWLAHPKTKFGIALLNGGAGIVASGFFQSIAKLFGSQKSAKKNKIDLQEYKVA